MINCKGLTANYMKKENFYNNGYIYSRMLMEILLVKKR